MNSIVGGVKNSVSGASALFKTFSGAKILASNKPNVTNKVTKNGGNMASGR